MVNTVPQIPTISDPITVSLCGENDFSGGVVNGSYADISHLKILSPVGAAYPELQGTTRLFINNSWLTY